MLNSGTVSYSREHTWFAQMNLRSNHVILGLGGDVQQITVQVSTRRLKIYLKNYMNF